MDFTLFSNMKPGDVIVIENEKYGCIYPGDFWTVKHSINKIKTTTNIVVDDPTGLEIHRFKDGIYNCLERPSVFNVFGSEWWYKDDNLHRIGGPAAIDMNVQTDQSWNEYFIDGKELTQSEYYSIMLVFVNNGQLSKEDYYQMLLKYS